MQKSGWIKLKNELKFKIEINIGAIPSALHNHSSSKAQ
jgi:hypothetical protein